MAALRKATGTTAYDQFNQPIPSPTAYTTPGVSGPAQPVATAQETYWTGPQPDPSYTLVGNQWANPNTYVNGVQVGDANGPVAPAAFDPNQWGNQDPAYINQLLDYIWQQNGQAPLAANDPQRAYWISKLQTPDVNGANQQLLGNDPYWQMRMGYGARGEDYEAQFQPAPVTATPTTTATPTGGGGSAVVQQTLAQAPSAADIMSRLNAILDAGGQFNSDLVNKNVESARETLEARRKGELDQVGAELAARGLNNSGEATNALGRLGEDLNTDFSGSVRDIYADELKNASDRYAQALSLATGMSVEDAKNAVAMAKINSDSQLGNADLALRRELGLGQLDLDKLLGLGSLDIQRGQLDLNSDLGWANVSNTSDANYTDILQILSGILGQTQNGYQS